MVDGTFSAAAAGAPEPLVLADLRKAAEMLRGPSRPRHGYLRASSPSRAVEAVRALAAGLTSIAVACVPELHEDGVLVLWRPSGPCAYLHPSTVELLRTVATFDAWMSREEGRRVVR